MFKRLFGFFFRIHSPTLSKWNGSVDFIFSLECVIFLVICLFQAAYAVGGHSFSATCIEYIILKIKPPAHRPQTVWSFFLFSSLFLICIHTNGPCLLKCLVSGFASCPSEAKGFRWAEEVCHWDTWATGDICFKLWNLLFSSCNIVVFYMVLSYFTT